MAERNPQKSSVLVVDDEDALRTLIRLRLERTGHYVVVGEAADTVDATRLAADAQPDVILLDLLLGSERGSDAIGALMREAPRTMIAALTALPAEDQEAAVRAAGAFSYYEKTMITRLPEYLREDLRTFRRALSGEDVVAPSALTRRHDGRSRP